MNLYFVCNRKILLIASILFLLTSSFAYGAGFSIIEQSVSGLGNAFAGGAVSPEDATTVFFNPAGLTHLTDPEIIGGVHVIMLSAEFKDQGSPHVLGGNLNGDNEGDGGVKKIAPNLYYSRQINERLAFGLGINAPFGLATKYNDTWVGRYHAIDTDLLTMNINPSLGYRINDQLSLGFGFSG